MQALSIQVNRTAVFSPGLLFKCPIAASTVNMSLYYCACHLQAMLASLPGDHFPATH